MPGLGRTPQSKPFPLGADDVRITRVAALGGMDLVKARFLTRRSAPHSHRELEIGVVNAGTRFVQCRGRIYQAPEASILAFAPGEVHAGFPDGVRGSEYRAFLIPEQLLLELGLASSPDEGAAFTPPVITNGPLARQLLEVHAALSRPGAEFDRSYDAQLRAMLELLCRMYQRQRESHKVARDAVARVRDYLGEHYANRVRLEELSRIAGLSVFHLIRVFRAETGLSPYAYLGQLRVHQAAALLRGGMAVSMVASVTGFADQSHLTRLFKRLFGVPPGEYRRACLVGCDHVPASPGRVSRHLRGRLVDFPTRLEPRALDGR